MRHVVFRVEKERYALPLSSVREVVVPPNAWSRVPRAPAAVKGVMNLRGRVVTVVEMARLLGMNEHDSALQKVVLLDRGRRDLGLLVSEVEGIESIERLSPAPGEQMKAVKGLARLKGLAVTVMDPDGLDAVVLELFTPNR